MLEEDRRLFNSNSMDEEKTIRGMLDSTMEQLRQPAGAEKVTLGFDAFSAGVVADMIDIGVAPASSALSRDIRLKARKYGKVRIQFNHDLCEDFAVMIEIGVIRHENGVTDPCKFTLH